MSFTKGEFDALAAAAPEGSFLGATHDKISEWFSFVASVDDNAKDKHALMFYGLAARLLAENKNIGSLVPVDFADTHTRTMVLDAVKPQTTPFISDDEGSPWRDETVLPAHLTCCLRVQGGAQKIQLSRPFVLFLRCSFQRYQERRVEL